MTEPNRIYPSKLILYGEYTILNGSSALAIPLHNTFSQWKIDHSEQQKNPYISALISFGNHIFELLEDAFDHDRFKSDIQNGLYLWSNIPIGYGMGSSGSVCAAFYDRYCLKKQKSLKNELSVLARMESYFHGKSSGMDPIVSYHQSAILKDESGINKVILGSKKSESPHLFLIDSAQSRSTSHLVDHYKKQCLTTSFLSDFVEPSKKLVHSLIHDTLQGDFTMIYSAFKSLSNLQFQFMDSMIIDPILNFWEKGLETDQYYLKLCGAGGGGFYLGITNDWTHTEVLAEQFNLIRI